MGKILTGKDMMETIENLFNWFSDVFMLCLIMPLNVFFLCCFNAFSLFQCLGSFM